MDRSIYLAAGAIALALTGCVWEGGDFNQRTGRASSGSNDEGGGRPREQIVVQPRAGDRIRLLPDGTVAIDGPAPVVRAPPRVPLPPVNCEACPARN